MGRDQKRKGVFLSLIVFFLFLNELQAGAATFVLSVGQGLRGAGKVSASVAMHSVEDEVFRLHLESWDRHAFEKKFSKIKPRLQSKMNAPELQHHSSKKKPTIDKLIFVTTSASAPDMAPKDFFVPLQEFLEDRVIVYATACVYISMFKPHFEIHALKSSLGVKEIIVIGYPNVIAPFHKWVVPDRFMEFSSYLKSKNRRNRVWNFVATTAAFIATGVLAYVDHTSLDSKVVEYGLEAALGALALYSATSRTSIKKDARVLCEKTDGTFKKASITHAQANDLVFTCMESSQKLIADCLDGDLKTTCDLKPKKQPMVVEFEQSDPGKGDP